MRRKSLSNRRRERVLKIGVFMFALLAAAAGPPAFAKGSDGHHAHRARAAKAAAHRSAPALHKTPEGNSVGDKIDVGGPATPLPLRDNGRSVTSPKVQIVKPDHTPTRRIGISVSPLPPVRNAIGQTAMPAGNVKTDLQSRTANSPQAGGPMSRQSGYSSGSIGNVKPIVRPSESAKESINLTRGGRIDGTALIRPASAASVGGPDKPVSGINGTQLRQKHR